VSAAGGTLHIYALGTVPVNNYGYSGPRPRPRHLTRSREPPVQLRRHCRNRGAGRRAGRRPAWTGVSWSDTVITGAVPALTAAQSTCGSITQQGSSAQCAVNW